MWLETLPASRQQGKPYRGRAISLKAPKKLPRILPVTETQAILDACTRLRDRFFFALLYESGCRAGEALGLRHEDIAAAEQEVSIVPRENANGARAKSGGRTVPVGGELIRLYADYLHEEYGGIDSDHVFVNIWAEPKGHAWAYQAAYDLVLRIRARTGIAFDPHWFRHSAGTSCDVPQHVVQKILDHETPEMTAHYARLTDTTVRRHWEAARKVNARGETVSLDPAGPLAEAAWAKQQLSRATQALPNGYCQLPAVKTCPHANLFDMPDVPHDRRVPPAASRPAAADPADHHHRRGERPRPPRRDEQAGRQQPGQHHRCPRSRQRRREGRSRRCILTHSRKPRPDGTS